jgi:hypothetical protein
MADIRIPVDLGFTEFVSQLVREVLHAVIASQLDQDQHRADLLVAASLDVDDFASAHVTDAHVDARLAELFPPTGDDRPHDAASGTPYRPATERTPEHPPFEATLGVRLVASDVSVDSGKLRASGARRLREAARTSLAERHLRATRELAADGVPRVLVDGGRVNARITFEALRYHDDGPLPDPPPPAAGGDRVPGERPPVSPVSPRRPLIVGGRLAQVQLPSVVPEVLRDVRLRVHTAGESDDEPATSRARVYGEVELTFRTVT